MTPKEVRQRVRQIFKDLGGRCTVAEATAECGRRGLIVTPRRVRAALTETLEDGLPFAIPLSQPRPR